MGEMKMSDYIATTSLGKIRGFEEDGMIKYLGIPYAEAPVGPLRLKRAVPKTPWEGIFDAKEYGNAPIQYNQGMVMGDEDCLTLNILTPPGADRLPVFLWIYGGG